MSHDHSLNQGLSVTSSLPAGARDDGFGTADVATSQLPSLIIQAGNQASRRFLEFFAATIRNPNTRAAYAQAVGQFLVWCEGRGLQLDTITPLVLAAYIERLTSTRSAPTVKQHLAAIRVCFDWLVSGHILLINPAWSVRGPRHVVKKGQTPVLTAAEARQLLDSIGTDTLLGLRDRTIIGVMVYTFARVGAIVKMNLGDYFQQGKRAWIRLHEKGGKVHDVPCHHNLEALLDAYINAAMLGDEKRSPLFRTCDGRAGRLTNHRTSRTDTLRMIKRRAQAAGLPSDKVCCHTFRATGITTYLENGGTLEHAQAIAAHESPRTTKLYDRTDDAISLDEIERIAI